MLIPLLWQLLLFVYAARTYALVDVEQVLAFPEGTAGSCSADQIDRIRTMFKQMQWATWVSNELLTTHIARLQDDGSRPAIPRVLSEALYSFLGIAVSGGAGYPIDLLEAFLQYGERRLTRAHATIQKLLDLLTTEASYSPPRRSWGSTPRPFVYCDSTVLEWWDPTRRIEPKDDLHALERTRRLDELNWYNAENWYWCLPIPDHDHEAAGGYVAEKIPTPENREVSPEGVPSTFCSKSTNYAFTIPRQDLLFSAEIQPPRRGKSPYVSTRHTIILCPNFFHRLDLYDYMDPDKGFHPQDPFWSYPDLLNPKAFPPGYPLDGAQANWIRLLRELAYIHFRSSGNTGVSVNVWTLRDTVKDNPRAIPRRRDWQQDPNREIEDPDQCLSLAQRDLAPPTSEQRHPLAIKSPMNISWFIVAVYLWVAGTHHQNWSTGRAFNIDVADFPPHIADLPDNPPAQDQDPVAEDDGDGGET